jgi:hypothetical protein
MTAGIHIKKFRVTANGREVKNPLPQGLAVALVVAVLGTIMVFTALMLLLLFLGISGLLATVFATVCAVVGLMALGHPLLRACGRRGVFQTTVDAEDKTSLKITTVGALERK